MCLRLACCALQSQHHLLGCLSLLVEHGLRLTTVTGLLAVVSALSLGEQRGLHREFVSRRFSAMDTISEGVSYFAGLVLSDFVLGVFLAGLALAVGVSGFGNVDLFPR